jgi:ABC-type Zn2+ transport system substrate-binding protein/surface adhesin
MNHAIRERERKEKGNDKEKERERKKRKRKRKHKKEEKRNREREKTGYLYKRHFFLFLTRINSGKIYSGKIYCNYEPETKFTKINWLLWPNTLEMYFLIRILK